MGSSDAVFKGIRTSTRFAYSRFSPRTIEGSNSPMTAPLNRASPSDCISLAEISACQGKNKLVQCDNNLAGLPRADGLILVDAHPGNPVNGVRVSIPQSRTRAAPVRSIPTGIRLTQRTVTTLRVLQDMPTNLRKSISKLLL